jgi:hypothetical protein
MQVFKDHAKFRSLSVYQIRQTRGFCVDSIQFTNGLAQRGAATEQSKAWLEAFKYHRWL